MGDKVSAKRAMTKAGVPVVPGSETNFDNNDAKKIASKIGYPVIIKAMAAAVEGMKVVLKELIGQLRSKKKRGLLLEMMPCIWKNI